MSALVRALLTEEALRQQEIALLAGGVAHDLNNLMSVVIGYSDLLIARAKPSDLNIEDLQEIRKAGQRAADLTRQLLAFSRKQLLSPRVIDLNRVVGDMEKLLGRLIGEDIDLVVVQGADLGRIKADLGQIGQIIMNLVVNGRDAMPDGGTLTIETVNVKRDDVHGQPHMGSGDDVMLAVSDTGCGMDAETKARLFVPFFTTKEAGKGTGLGLSMVYGIVKQSGGHIRVSSEPGKGTTFRIYLPRVEDPLEVVKPDEVLAGTRRGTETILLVGDEDSLRKLAGTILRTNGYTVWEACDGVEAIEIVELEKRSIHLVVTDSVLPRMSGPELVERLARSLPGLKSLHTFLEKPFSVGQMAEKVREVLDKPQ
jgi:two-component sensor histidine kinase